MWSFKPRTVTKTRKRQHLAGDDDGPAAEYAGLVRAAAGGDRGALERLLVRAQEIALRFSFMACGHTEDAEDVMQDALLQTYRYVARIKRPEAFRTWLFATVRNACLMKRRRRVDEPRRHVSLEQGLPTGDGEFAPIDVEDYAMKPDEAAINGWLGRQLRAAMNSLPPSHRVIMFLREMEGLSTREVARVLGISESKVKTQLHRARVKLREQLGASASVPVRSRTL
jgi:RNA polymerase sigma-70 factor (ECF subfamily)